MQKLSGELKNVPGDAPLVPRSTNPKVVARETEDTEGRKLTDDNLEVDQRQQRVDQSQPVSDNIFVLDVDGEPLMPTNPRKARILLKEGKSKVVKRRPFTIQLLYPSGHNKQEITLGIDPGYANVGFSAVTEKKELMSGTLKLENGMKNRLEKKKRYRKARRQRIWFREERYNNRANAREEGKLMPSVQRRLDTHMKLTEKEIMGLLPITKTIIEVSNFDIQKINNTEISGKEYQQGSLYGYKNLQSFVIAREENKCQLCGGGYNGKWNLHHIISRSNGGTDKPDNIALLHEECHKRLHRERLEKKLKKSKQHKAETFMNTIKWRLVERLSNLCPTELTYGYITNMKRNELDLEKTHYNDAFVIACGDSQERCKPTEILQKKRNNRCLQKNRNGFKPSIRKQRYSIQPKDVIWVNGKEYRSKGMFDQGRYVIYGDTKKKEWFNVKLVEKVFHTGGFVYEK